MILDVLQQNNVVSKQHAKATPLTGGVSCEIYLVEDEKQRFVAKRALSKLKVELDWFANTNRNVFEQRYLTYVGERFPQYVPKILHSLEQAQLFTMEYLPEQFKDWKKRLLNKQMSTEVASMIGEALGNIHRCSWQDEQAKQLFQSDENFYQLRLEPYFEAMRSVHPSLEHKINALVGEVANTKLCLVHGDYSPKNILVSNDEIKIVDCEVAWFGDPSFDVAFMLHHLLLKALHFDNARFQILASCFFTSYVATLGQERYQHIDQNHLVNLTLFMMLARLDGKSPVEYLTDEKKQHIRSLVLEMIAQPPADPQALILGVM